MTTMPTAWPERFSSKVDASQGDAGCWVWVGCIGAQGYGRFRHDGEATLAHRAGLHLLGHAVGPNMRVYHSCGDRRCVNPAHLITTPRVDGRLRGEAARADAAIALSAPRWDTFPGEWPERFSSKVKMPDDPEDCWLWTARHSTTGYAQYWLGRGQRPRNTNAARHGYQLANPDADTDGLLINHLCHNNSCVNPNHMIPATITEAIYRGEGTNELSGLCRAGLHQWGPETIAVHSGASICRPCVRAKDRALKAKQRAARRAQTLSSGK